MDKLTVKQKEILDCIKKYIAFNGYPPTVREICLLKGYSSTSTVQSYINKLIEKGLIKKDGIKNRSLKLLVENEFENKKTISIPVIYSNSFIELPISLFSKETNYYAYIMPDDSLVCDHILKGDSLIISKQKSFSSNDFVVYMDNVIGISKYNDSLKNIIGKVVFVFRDLNF